MTKTWRWTAGGMYLIGLVAILFDLAGCAAPVRFAGPVLVQQGGRETAFEFDTDGDKRPDFWQFQSAGGRKTAISYATDSGDSPGPRVDLDKINPSDCPHFMIVLDGVPFELVDELYREGAFRFFHPPTKVVCCFPSMTDLALSQLFHSPPCTAYQALYFDRATNRLSDGNAVYLSGDSAPWMKSVDYRCSMWWDTLCYLDPQTVFNHELRGFMETLAAAEDGEIVAYSVGSAGLGTRGGRDAILKYLRTIDRLCEQIIYERHGRVKITVTADHGHDLTPNRRVAFRETLEAGGYRKSKSINDLRDVVEISYGLVTCAAFYTDDPAGVAECLLTHDDVEFACYPEGESVIVRNRDGLARITKGAGGFKYDCSAGDPLGVAGVISELSQNGKVNVAGEIDGSAFFAATLNHYYPDGLDRVWTAFHGLVVKPPDLIVNLRDGACHGSKFFETMIGEVTSTHGSLNARNSTTFALTTLGELPPALRTRELLPALHRLRGK